MTCCVPTCSREAIIRLEGADKAEAKPLWFCGGCVLKYIAMGYEPVETLP